jgi:hypothetical protein
MVFPAFGRGGGAFQWWGGARDVRTALVFCHKGLFVCCNYWFRGPSQGDGRYMLFPNRRDRQVAARAGILRSLSRGQAMNRLYLYKREKVFI